MKNLSISRTAILALVVLLCMACVNAKKSSEANINYFEIGDVKLTPSPFYDAMKLDEAWLLQLEPDRLMSGFRLEAGLTPKAPKYGGWEGQGIAGQSFGHYLSACAMMYATTENEELNDRRSIRRMPTSYGKWSYCRIPESKRIIRRG